MKTEVKNNIQIKDINLDQITQLIPEARKIMFASYGNSKKDGAGRKFGELTKKELESYTKAVLRHKNNPQSCDHIIYITLQGVPFCSECLKKIGAL